MAWQEVDPRETGLNAITAFPGYCLVTAGNEKENNPMLIGWGSLGYMWRRPVASAYIRKSRYTREILDKTGIFTMSFLPEKYKKQEAYCGTHSGRDGDKFEGSGLHRVILDGACGVEEADIILVCRPIVRSLLTKDQYLDDAVYERWYGEEQNDHYMYMAEIVKAYKKA